MKHSDSASELDDAALFDSHRADLDWSRYASQYNEMCELIPAYQDNIDALLQLLPSFNLPEDPRILDLGAGTGNYILALHDALPGATFTHVDMDPVMNSEAAHHYAKQNVSVEIVQEYIQRVEFPDEAFDLILCVNALCHASPQAAVLEKMRQWLASEGTLFLIDFGREQKILDWGVYIFLNTVRRFGLRRYIRALTRNWETVRTNVKARTKQQDGLMWLHTPAEFSQVIRDADFLLQQSRTCYRGYCDLAVCRKA